ncbi:MAG: DNA-binding MarR family transcriptional regulator [Psychromonas sp.]|jgi:DNA-binding MarR family transcriptional regulator|uniref:MarR family winged helix-turn-helix transcriptional regulator n=1 Tax=Psychromonas sp. TaxID=1884585 RepID=UPI0039E287A8
MTDFDNKYIVDESFPMMMSTCVKYMRETLNARFTKSGCNITSEQWMLLIYLAEQDGITQQTLAGFCAISKVSVLNLIKKLEINNLIVRHPDPVDARSNRVYLTNKGRKIKNSLIPLAKANIKQMTEGISNDDIELLKRTVKKITINLER